MDGGRNLRRSRIRSAASPFLVTCLHEHELNATNFSARTCYKNPNPFGGSRLRLKSQITQVQGALYHSDPMSDEVEMRQAKCRRDYKAAVKQGRRLTEILQANDSGPQKKQKRSKNSEAGNTVIRADMTEKIDRKKLEETIRGFLQELD